MFNAVFNVRYRLLFFSMFTLKLLVAALSMHGGDGHLLSVMGMGFYFFFSYVKTPVSHHM